MSARRRASARGFTLIELMIAITIVGILAGVAVPAFMNLIRDNRRAAVVNELLTNIMLARAEAAKRGLAVSVCGNTATGGASCTGGQTWDYGWMVFLDDNGDGAIASTNDVLKRFVNDYPDIRVRSDTNGATSGHVVMRPFNQGATETQILVCDKRGSAKARAVCIARNGRSRSSETDCADGSALVCP